MSPSRKEQTCKKLKIEEISYPSNPVQQNKAFVEENKQ
jgi:hypothetical protein